MNRSLFILLLLIQFTNILAQNNNEGVFLSSTGKTQLTYVELTAQAGTVFKLGRWIDKGGSGYSMLTVDTILLHPGAPIFLLTGKTTTLQQTGNKLYLNLQDRKRTKTIEMDTSSNIDEINSNLNNAYWWTNFLKMQDSINSTFKLQHYSFRNGFGIWESFANKTIYYKTFSTHADTRIKVIRDSITSIHTPYASLTNEVIKNIGAINYLSLKDSVAKLLMDSSSTGGYFGAIINSVSNNRPELFFKLADDMPDRKEMLFSAVNGRSTFAKLKAVETNTPAKKEFIKVKRKDRGFTFKAIGIAIVGAALLGFSVYALAK